jgi:hypothetical protein
MKAVSALKLFNALGKKQWKLILNFVASKLIWTFHSKECSGYNTETGFLINKTDGSSLGNKELAM